MVGMESECCTTDLVTDRGGRTSNCCDELGRKLDRHTMHVLKVLKEFIILIPVIVEGVQPPLPLPRITHYTK
jgi:hypothetical protein